MKKLFLLPLLLASCAPQLSQSDLAVRLPVQGRATPLNVVYHLTSSPADLGADKEGSARLIGKTCFITLRADAVNAQLAAHEVAHCLDAGRSRHFGRAGCILRPYACDPAEGFADTYGLLYRSRFGNQLDALGLGAPTTDPLPDPDDVTPDILDRLLTSFTAHQH